MLSLFLSPVVTTGILEYLVQDYNQIENSSLPLTQLIRSFVEMNARKRFLKTKIFNFEKKRMNWFRKRDEALLQKYDSLSSSPLLLF